MIVVLVLLGLALLAAPGVARRPPRRVPAGEWTVVVTLALTMGAVTVLAALSLAALPAASAMVGAATLAGHCRGVLAPLAPDPTFLSWGASLLALGLLARLVHGWSRAIAIARNVRVEPWLGAHRDEPEFELVVLPTPEVLAFGVPGRRPQIVISNGLIDDLDPAETAAVIDHEAAHHRLHHSRYLALVAGVEAGFGWIGPVRRSAEAVRVSIEAWADDEARACNPGSRSSLHRALQRVGRPTLHTNERLDRLTRARRPHSTPARVVAFATLALVLLTAALIATGWFTDAHHAVALGGPCAH